MICEQSNILNNFSGFFQECSVFPNVSHVFEIICNVLLHTTSVTLDINH